MIKKQSGNSVLEFILFLPLVFFFLFVVIDAGLCFIQRAAINDAFRSTINSIPAIAKNEKEYIEISKKVAAELELNVSKVFDSYSGEVSYELLTKLYKLEIDVVTGKLLSSSPSEIQDIHSGKIVEQSLLENFNNSEEYVANILNQDLENEVSNFAQAQGSIDHPLNHQLSGLRYSQNSWLLYSEVRAIPVGINSSFLKSSLGGLYSMQLQNLEKLRD